MILWAGLVLATAGFLVTGQAEDRRWKLDRQANARA